MIPTMHLKAEPIEHPFTHNGETRMLVTGYRILQWWSEHGCKEGEQIQCNGIKPREIIGGDGKSHIGHFMESWTEPETGEWRYLDGCEP